MFDSKKTQQNITPGPEVANKFSLLCPHFSYFFSSDLYKIKNLYLHPFASLEMLPLVTHERTFRGGCAAKPQAHLA